MSFPKKEKRKKIREINWKVFMVIGHSSFHAFNSNNDTHFDKVATPTTYLSQPHFEASVRMRLTLPKMGIWSPPGLPQLQSSTTEGKTLALRCSLYCWKGFEV